MKATGIVRRIDAGVIKTPRIIHSKSGVDFHSAFICDIINFRKIATNLKIWVVV